MALLALVLSLCLSTPVQPKLELLYAFAPETNKVRLVFSGAVAPPAPSGVEISSNVTALSIEQTKTNVLVVTTSPLQLGTIYSIILSNMDGKPSPYLSPNPVEASFAVEHYTNDFSGLIVLPRTPHLRPGYLGQRGFHADVRQTVSPVLRDMEDGLALLNRTLIDPQTGKPAVFTGFYSGSYTGSVNFAVAGGFPATAPPGITRTNNSNLAMALSGWLELNAGIHHWVIRSADIWRLQTLSKLQSADRVVLAEGEPNSGEEALLEVLVPESGQYFCEFVALNSGSNEMLQWLTADGEEELFVNSDSGAYAYQPPAEAWGAQMLVTRAQESVTLSWNSRGVLQQAPCLTGPWSEIVTTNRSFAFAPTNSAGFFRIETQL